MGLENVEEKNTKYNNLRGTELLEHLVQEALADIEDGLAKNQFVLASESIISRVFNDNSLFCRSESLSEITKLLQEDIPLLISNNRGAANMCSMRSGVGFKIAMSEGFSREEKDAVTKIVLTFKGNGLASKEKIDPANSIWQTKPSTAEVSLSGSGNITLEDMKMISVRYPVKYFPENSYTESEKDRLEEADIKFIVRHYIPKIKSTTH